jgi:RES domain-containing protein
VYLAQPEAACVAEFVRMAEATGASPQALLRRGRELHDVEVAGLPVLDLTADGALDHVGLTPEDVGDDDWLPCQAVGEAAHFLGVAGIAAPSATRLGIVLAAFENRVGPGQLTVLQSKPFSAALLP